MQWVRRLLVSLIVVGGIGYAVYVKWLRPIPVVAYETALGTVVVEVMGTGTLQARTSTIISPKIPGRLLELGVDQGDSADSGQIVARLDDVDLASQVEIAQATLEAVEAGLDRLRAEQARAQAVLRQAQRDDERIRESFRQGAATESEIDKAEEQVAVAQADTARADAAIAEGMKQFIAVRKTLEYQQARLDDTVIRAPFKGLIVRRDRNPGDIVVPGSSIYEVIADDEIWVSAWVDETSMAALSPGQPARIILRSEPDRPFPGHVVRLGRETDPETREFIVDVAIEQLPRHWAIGQRAEAFIEAQRLEEVLTVPLTYVFVKEGARGVFVNREGRAEWTACEFGARGREVVEARSGLQPGDIIVRLADPGTRVRLDDGRRIVVE